MTKGGGRRTSRVEQSDASGSRWVLFVDVDLVWDVKWMSVGVVWDLQRMRCRQVVPPTSQPPNPPTPNLRWLSRSHPVHCLICLCLDSLTTDLSVCLQLPSFGPREGTLRVVKVECFVIYAMKRLSWWDVPFHTYTPPPFSISFSSSDEAQLPAWTLSNHRPLHFPLIYFSSSTTGFPSYPFPPSALSRSANSSSCIPLFNPLSSNFPKSTLEGSSPH